jgi:hypothetical protein
MDSIFGRFIIRTAKGIADRNRAPGPERERVMRENRKDKRITEENRVAIELPGVPTSAEARVINALTKDISLGGARIVTDRLFEVGSSLRMTLYLSKSKQVTKVRADVRWNRMIEDGLYEIGVEFEHGIPTGVLVLIYHLYGKGQNVPTSVQA